MKIYFLLMIVSVFVALSYIPIRAEPKQNPAAPPEFSTGLMPKA